MSTMPWGTMNGWLRTEGEQRGAWAGRRVQDVRAARLVRPAEPVMAARAATPHLAPAVPLRRSTTRPDAQSSRSQESFTEVA